MYINLKDNLSTNELISESFDYNWTLFYLIPTYKI